MAELRRIDVAFSHWRTATKIGAVGIGQQPVIDGRYRLDERIGVGSYGYVYQAHDLVLDRPVAIKTGAPKISDEARALAKLRHPNAVILYDHGTEGDAGYLVLELLSGQTLRQWRQSEPRDLAQIMRVYLDAARGLAAAHAAGVVHRDFKPDNVIVTRSGRVVVLDFGVATAPGVDHVSTAGTLRYMAPEQLIASPAIGPEADQFAFCVALWEAITGAPPFEGEDELGHLAARIIGPQGSEPPTGIGNLLRVGLQPSPSSRWPGMPMLIAELERAAKQTRRRPLLLAAILLATALGLGVIPGGPTLGDTEAEPGAFVPIQSTDDKALAAARSGHADTALSLLAKARGHSKSGVELLRVADLADEVGLELYRQGEWLGSAEAHAVAHDLYRESKRQDMAMRSLALVRLAEEARLAQ